MSSPVSLKHYFAAAGSPFTKADAEIIGPQVEALAEQGDVTERSLVDAAHSNNSPLNRFFVWDNEEAGDRYRLIQAGQMLRSIRVRVVVDERPKVMPAYKLLARTPAARPAPKGYNALHDSSATAARMTTAAYDDLMAWRAKYEACFTVWLDFATVFRQVANQISELADGGRPTNLDHETDDALVALVAWRDRFGSVVENWDELAEQGSFVVEAISAAEVAFIRPTTRPCLRCGTSIQSVGHGNRLCERCSVAASKGA